MWDELPSGPARRQSARSWGRFITEATAASASFMLSLAVFSVAGLNALRGPEMKVVPPESFLLYRDGSADRAQLVLAMEVRMINEANTAYGDVLVQANAGITVADDGPTAGFETDTLIEDVFTMTPEKQAENCSFGARCVVATGHLFIERPYKLLDIAGAASRTEQLGFTLGDHRCEAAQPALCGRFDNFNTSVRHLRTSRPLSVELTLRFNGDGQKTVLCTSTSDPAKLAAIFNYLETRGWTTVTCERVL